MIDRRTFLVLGGAAGAVAQSAKAQQQKRLPVVALVLGTAKPEDMAGPDPKFFAARAFLHTLRDLGWVEGRTVQIERRTAELQPERMPSIMAELVARNVDVIVVGATDWVRDGVLGAAQSTPIVGLFTEDPVVAGTVASLRRPGGNLTGAATSTGREIYDKRVQLLMEMAPRSTRLGFFGRRSAWEAYRTDAGSSESRLLLLLVESPNDFEAAFATIARERIDALIVSHGPFLFGQAGRIASFALERRLPSVFPWRQAVEAGGLMSYGPHVAEQFRQLASYTDRILRGAKPAELPIEQPTRFQLVINGKTAQALGLTIPTALLVQADEVIE